MEAQDKTNAGVEAMRRSLDEVRRAFPQLVRERDTTVVKLQDLNAKISAAVALFHAFGEAPPAVAPETVPDEPLVLTRTAAVTTPVQKSVEPYIDTLLSGGRFKATELQAEINRQFGLDFAMSTIYRILTKGHKEGRYESVGGYWQKHDKGAAFS
jgi:hypothetical protein